MIPPCCNPAFVRSQAERELFERLRRESGTDDWIVLHSLALAEHRRQRAGEIDFILITPLGVFCLEVKGGIVRRENGLWIYGASREDRTTTQRSPFDQAREGMFSLEDRLKAKESPLSRLLFGYGVFAPDCELKASMARSEISENPGFVYDFSDRRSSLREYVRRLSAETTKRYSAAGINDRFCPSKKEAEELAALLRGDFEAAVSDLSLAQDVSRHLVYLEETQREALDSFMQDERAIVLGAAGTGKTILAAEAAVRTLQAGKKVLLLTYNKNLAHYISAKVQENVGDLLKVSSIHELMVKTLEASPFKDELATGLPVADETFWHTWLPQHFALAQSEHSPICDVLIIDEGQDILTEHYLNAVDTLLDGGLCNGRWLWCMDDTNQGAVYGRCDNQASQRLRSLGVSSRLRANIRNTRQIAEAAQKLAGPKLTAGASIEGAAVTYHRVHDAKEARRRILSVVRDLLDEGVSPGQITVLSKHRHPSWGFEAVASELPATVWLDQPAARQLAEHQVEAVSFSTISGFKGLENDFIIVTEVEDLTTELGRALTYVAMTRARAKLIMLLSPEADAQRLRDGA